MIDRDDDDRDLTSLTVPRVGRLAQSGDVWQPWRLLDPAGEVVDPVAAWLRDLQAAGRSASTQRSYGMDLLRWFRFLWALDVAWNHASRAEARDFARWVRITEKPRSPSADAGIPNPVTGKPNPGNKYAASTRRHSESVLRGFYEFHREAESGPMVNPFPGTPSAAGARPPQSDAALPRRAVRALPAAPCPAGAAQYPGREVQRPVRPASFTPRPGPGRLLGVLGRAGVGDSSAAVSATPTRVSS